RSGIKHVKSSSYHPQTNGVAERFHRTLNDMLSMYVNQDEDHREWATYLPELCFAYQSAKHDGTGFSPFELMYGVEARIPWDNMFPQEDDNHPDPTMQAVDTYARMRVLCELAKENLHTSQARMKRNYDKARRDVEIPVGSLVGVFRP